MEPRSNLVGFLSPAILGATVCFLMLMTVMMLIGGINTRLDRIEELAMDRVTELRGKISWVSSINEDLQDQMIMVTRDVRECRQENEIILKTLKRITKK